MINLEINGKVVEANNNETILDVLKREKIEVPTLCHLKELTPTGACRMCVVEVEGMRNLVTSCSYPAMDGMKIKTHSKRVMDSRKTIIELLLANHPDECLYCSRNGDCSLSKLAKDYNVVRKNFSDFTRRNFMDVSSPSIIRDVDKCILCGKCVRVCEEIQGVSAIDFIKRGSEAKVEVAFKEGLNSSSCVNCGQCVNVCPTGALSEHPNINEVLEVLRDENLFVTIQHAPAVSVSIAEEFGVDAGEDINGKLVASMRKMGFDRVFDTSFSADLTIMEEGSELVDRLKRGGKFPMITSCCPGWVKFMEEFYPEFMENVSSCKSPQQMLGAVIKSYFAQREKIDAKKIVNVAVMPCTAKKFEALRPEMKDDKNQDIDIVLTTREFAKLIRIFGMDLKKIETDTADTPFGERSSAGKMFAASGGVMEAAVRSAYFLLTGKELGISEIKEIRGLEGIKEAKVDIDGKELKVAVVSGLKNVGNLLEKIKSGEKEIDFIEFMACPGGCINGGGQPRNQEVDALKQRMKKLYEIDATSELRVSHKNPSIKRIYDEFLGVPLGEKSHHLLHTTYINREVIK